MRKHEGCTVGGEQTAVNASVDPFLRITAHNFSDEANLGLARAERCGFDDGQGRSAKPVGPGENGILNTRRKVPGFRPQ